MDRGALLDRLLIQCRVKNHGLALLRATEGIKRQLVEHVPRQRLLPEVPVLGIEHRHDLVALQDHEVGT